MHDPASDSGSAIENDLENIQSKHRPVAGTSSEQWAIKLSRVAEAAVPSCHDFRPFLTKAVLASRWVRSMATPCHARGKAL